jgi:putative Ca2+/H+ antiporter (TMEM165/GDT1 family)
MQVHPMTTFESVFLWAECLACLAGIVLAVRFRRDIVLTAADVASLFFWMLVLCIGVGLFAEYAHHREMTFHLVCAAVLIGGAWLLKPRRSQRWKPST